MNRAFLYGDLLFETIYIQNGRARFGRLHFERLTKGAGVLGFELPPMWDYAYFEQLVTAQCPQPDMRARLVAYRFGNGFYLPNSNEIRFDIEYWPLKPCPSVISKVDVFEDQHKACNTLSNLKTGNALLFVMAARFGHEKGLDDVLILNEHGRIAEAGCSNIFWIRQGIIHTPPLSEGPVAGVMRQALLDLIAKQGLMVTEIPLAIEDLAEADECFVTNAVNGIVSVKSFRNKKFETEISDTLKKLISNIPMRQMQ